MGKFLLCYLIVTGIGAAIVLGAPAIVVVGFIFLIIPGLFLMMLPTAFVWGAIFAAFWWPTRPFIGPWAALLLAVGGTAAVVTTIPQMANRQIQAEIDALRAEDRDAIAKIALHGVVRFERTSWKVAQMSDPAWQAQMDAFKTERKSIDWTKRPVACDVLCAAALFTPDVEAVIIAPVLAPDAKPRKLEAAGEFRLERQAGCTGSLEPQDAASFYDGVENDNVLRDEWRVRIAQGACIRRDTATSAADFTVSISDWRVEGTSSPLPHPHMHLLRMTILDRAGKVLLRRTRVRTAFFDSVLWMNGVGGMQDFHFQWAQEAPREGEEPGAFKPAAMLASATSMQLATDPQRLADGARERLSAALSDPARPASDPVFVLSDRVLQDISENGLRPGDVELVERIVADQRTRNFVRVWDVVRKMGPDALRLRDPIVRRILATDYPEREWSGVNQLGRVLRELPPGTFAAPTEAEAQLLADVGRRNLAMGLIERQADRGGDGAQILAQVIVDTWTLPVDKNRTRDTDGANAAWRGLCLLGSAAASVLPAIEELIAKNLLPARVLEDRDSQFTLARLGRPVESFHSPKNHSWSDAQLQSWLRRRLANYDPRRDCR